MYFSNENTQAVTEEDQTLLFQVSLVLRTLCFVGAEMKKKNSKWKIRTIECHSIARLLFFIFKKELCLVDGLLIGLTHTEDSKSMKVMQTRHSWLKTSDGAIIDPYPMGIISVTGAILLPSPSTIYCAHGYNLYRDHPAIKEEVDLTRACKNARSLMRVLRKHKDLIKFNELIKDLI